MARIVLPVIGLAAAVGLAGCQAISGYTPTTSAEIAGDWRLTDINGEQMRTLLPVGDRVPTITIGDEGQLSGFTGVNRMNGQIDTAALAEGRWVLGPVATTKMAGAGEHMAVEALFLATLAKADAVHLRGDYLTLSDDGTPILKFWRE